MSHPERMCVGCRQRFQQEQLLRVNRRSDGELRLATGRTSRGRSAYVCGVLDCVERATRRQGWSRAFRGKVRFDALEGSLRAHISSAPQTSTPPAAHAEGGK